MSAAALLGCIAPLTPEPVGSVCCACDAIVYVVSLLPFTREKSSDGMCRVRKGMKKAIDNLHFA